MVCLQVVEEMESSSTFAGGGGNSRKVSDTRGFRMEVEGQLDLRPCGHQVAGHLFEAGKFGSLVDDFGCFYKPLQPGMRGVRELAFYERTFCNAQPKDRSGGGLEDGGKLRDSESPWDWRDVLQKFVPRFSGTIMFGGRKMLVLEDVGAVYSKPCVIDIKIGHKTWYNTADEGYIARARAKDRATTQAMLGFKVCGWQVYKHSNGTICRGSKSICKTLTENDVEKAFLDFADNETGLGPQSVFGGTFGALTQMLELKAWFEHQRHFRFYSSSILILYEGSAACPEDLNLRVCIVDFAHTFAAEGKKDCNFIEGLTSLIECLRSLSEDRTSKRSCKACNLTSKSWMASTKEESSKGGPHVSKLTASSLLTDTTSHC